MFKPFRELLIIDTEQNIYQLQLKTNKIIDETLTFSSLVISLPPKRINELTETNNQIISINEIKATKVVNPILEGSTKSEEIIF